MDGGVVMTAHTEGTLSKHLAVSEVGNSTLLVEDVEQHAILGLARNDNHIVEVFGSCADERDATYINLLDNVGLRSAAGNGLLERIEVNDDEVYFRNVILLHLVNVASVVATGEDATENFRVQGLHTTTKN